MEMKLTENGELKIEMGKLEMFCGWERLRKGKIND
jgi:hypothetical protein